jgi:hypothetical protein
MVLASREESAEDSMKPKVGSAIALGDEALSKGSIKVLDEMSNSNKVSDALAGKLSYILHNDCSSTHLPSASVNVVSQRPTPSSPPHASSATSQRKQSIGKKLQHVPLDKDAIARCNGTARLNSY